MYACMYINMSVCLSVCLSVYSYFSVYVRVCKHVGMQHVLVHACMCASVWPLSIGSVPVHTHPTVCAHLYVCMHAY